MTVVDESVIPYDPYDAEIQASPWAIYRRMRDEAPLFYNSQHDAYAVTRRTDVEAALKDPQTFTSGRGGILEIIKAGIEFPPGLVIFEDPPTHTTHRGLMSRVFTPRKVAALEPKIREFCARSLDPRVGTGSFDFVRDLGNELPMQVIGMLLGIPEADREAVRERTYDNLRTEEGKPMDVEHGTAGLDGAFFADYIDWRRQHPSDDIMTDLLNAEFEDEHGVRRTLTREEVLTYVNVIAGAGNETTGRLIGWMGKLLGEHPDQRRDIVADRSLIPGAVEEVIRYEPIGLHMARYVARDVEIHGITVPEGSVMLVIVGAANRDERHWTDPEQFDIRRNEGPSLSFGFGTHFCLGAALARIEGRIALDEILDRFPDWEIDTDHVERAITSTVRGFERMPAVVV